MDAKGRITGEQKAALDTVIRAGAARRSKQNLDDYSKIPPDKIHSVRRNVSRIHKKEVSMQKKTWRPRIHRHICRKDRIC